ncbi:MAG: iron chelate uptake ABC transporter family permease subunit, partial [Rhodobacteraceae bacterium]|nr:iron chelate uptake ABC transporter family permease subunit [Paracoccaceae bacterium]
MRNGIIALAAMTFLCLVSLFVGVIDLTPTDLFSDPEALGLLLVSRIPRTVAVVLTGASMAVAGLIMQLLVRNRFVEPATAGTAQSAALGILTVTLLMPDISVIGRMVVASLFSLVGTSLFIFLVRRLPPDRPLLIPLVGFIYGGVIGAAVTFVAYQADLLQYLEVWMNGEFSGVLQGRYELLWLSGGLTIFAYLVADQLTIAGLGR